MKKLFWNKAIILGALATTSSVAVALSLNDNKNKSPKSNLKINANNGLLYMRVLPTDNTWKETLEKYRDWRNSEESNRPEFSRWTDLKRFNFKNRVYANKGSYKTVGNDSVEIYPQNGKYFHEEGWIYDINGLKPFKVWSDSHWKTFWINIRDDERTRTYNFSVDYMEWINKSPWSYNYIMNKGSRADTTVYFKEDHGREKEYTEAFEKDSGNFDEDEFYECKFPIFSRSQVFNKIGGKDSWKNRAFNSINANDSHRHIVKNPEQIYRAYITGFSADISYWGQDMWGPNNVRTHITGIDNLKVKYAYRATVHETSDVNLMYKIPWIDTSRNYTQDQLRDLIEIYSEYDKENEIKNLKIKNITIDKKAKKIYFYEDFAGQSIDIPSKGKYHFWKNSPERRSIEFNEIDWTKFGVDKHLFEKLSLLGQ